MQFHIDRFTKLGGAFIVHGWSDNFRPGDRLTLAADGVPLETITRAHTRHDLPPHHGAGSEAWGFRAYGIDEGGNSHAAASISLHFADGARITRLSEASALPSDNLAYDMWTGFVAEANAKGGRLVEIGSRARSGSTVRSQFGPNIDYIGVDVTEGPNVDIVADAHHLSDAIDRPVDYICSISTFEHFIMPWKVALEANKILKPGGRIFSHSHQAWPEHDAPFDYFRFSEQAWSGLFNLHTGFRIVEARVAHAMTVAAMCNSGGPFEELEHSWGHGMSVCIAEKIADPLVQWDAPTALIRDVVYTY